MKKRLLLFTLIISCLLSQAQVVLNEQFDSGTFPPTGWSIDSHAANWSAENTSAAGGSAPEAFFYYYPDFNGTTRLISPVIDLTGHSTILLEFSHFIDHYDLSYNIGIATRSGEGEWSTAWSISVNSSISATTIMVPVSDANTGSSDFQFCLYFSGNSYNINSWSVDNIKLSIPAELDGAITKINTPTYFISDNVTSVISNVGLTTITGFKVKWQVDDGPVQTDTITGLDLSLGDSYNYVSTQILTPEAGLHTLSVWILNVNGNVNPDDVPANDIAEKTISIPSQTVEKVPFFEEFTSSTCGPCAYFNNDIFNPFLSQNESELVYVKYQMDWPGAGDPYYTDEGGDRRNYYGVNAVPMLYVEGKNVSTTSSGVNNAFNDALNTLAFVVVSSYYTVDGNSLYVRGYFQSYADLFNTTLHIIAFENLTTENEASNGETEFHHVMMKMIPNAQGTYFDTIQAGIAYEFEHTVDMSGTFVEEMEDLNVAIFLQENSTREVFQSAYANQSGVGVVNIERESLSIYPNPSNDQLHITIPGSKSSEMTVEVFNSMGLLVKSFNTEGNTTCTIKNDLIKGIYTIRVLGEGQQFTGKFISIN